MSRPLANLLTLACSLLVALATIYICYTRIRQPETFMDWAALFLSGATTGTIAFFIIWGHRQKDPTATQK